jgi:hypothetical protein
MADTSLIDVAVMGKQFLQTLSFHVCDIVEAFHHREAVVNFIL